jgi:hypothetical protein
MPDVQGLHPMLFDAIADAGLGQGLAAPVHTASAPSAKRLAGLRPLVAEDKLNTRRAVAPWAPARPHRFRRPLRGRRKPIPAFHQVPCRTELPAKSTT